MNVIFFKVGDISVFETHIRYVGGLLSCYALTGDEMFKEKAVHVANKLLPAFDSPTGKKKSFHPIFIRFSHSLSVALTMCITIDQT